MSHTDAARQIWKRTSTAVPHARRAQKMTQGFQILAGQLQMRVPEISRFCALLYDCAPPLNEARHWTPRAFMVRMWSPMNDSSLAAGICKECAPIQSLQHRSLTLQRLSWVRSDSLRLE